MNDIWETIRSFFNYPIIDWWSSPVEAQDAISATETTEAVEAIEAVPSELIFQFSIINIILVFVIYLVAKIFVKYIKRYFKAHHLTDKQSKTSDTPQCETPYLEFGKTHKQRCFLSLDADY